MKNYATRKIIGGSAALTILLGLTACQTAPKDSALLAQARQAVGQAESDPSVTKFSPTELICPTEV